MTAVGISIWAARVLLACCDIMRILCCAQTILLVTTETQRHRGYFWVLEHEEVEEAKTAYLNDMFERRV